MKIRTGPDGGRETAPEVAQRAEAAGAAAVDLHARSVAQAYIGDADWAAVRRVKQAVRIPVLGSGSIRQAADAMRFLEQTGADAVAIGRGCLGNPWIFREAKALVQDAGHVLPPTRAERGRAVLRLVEGEFRLYGTPLALRRLARTSCYFAKFLPDFPTFRAAVHQVRTWTDFGGW